MVFKSLLPSGTVKRLGRTFVATVNNAKTVGGIYKVKRRRSGDRISE
jgi:hypothetical protein